MKIPLKEEAKEINPLVRSQIQIHQPAPPRKYLNIFLSGSWSQINALVRRIFSRIHEEEDMQKFYGYAVAQIYRHALKVSCKFMQALEKYQPEGKKDKMMHFGYNMKMWDFYVWDLICESGRFEDEGNLGRQVIHYLINDSDAIVNTLRLCSNEIEIMQFIKRFEMSNNSAMNHCIAHFSMFEERYGKVENSVEYDNKLLTAFNEIMIRNEEITEVKELTNGEVIEYALKYAKRENTVSKFQLFPLSFGIELENSLEILDLDKKLIDFTERMENRKFTLALDDFKHNKEPLPVLSPVKKHADLIVATNRPDQYLYVVYADKAKKLRLLDNNEYRV